MRKDGKKYVPEGLSIREKKHGKTIDNGQAAVRNGNPSKK